MTVVINGNGTIPPKSAVQPAGSVLQVVTASYTTQVSSSGSSYTNTGIDVAITPTSSSSKVLVIATVPWSLYRDATEVGAALKIIRETTDVSVHEYGIHIEAGLTSQNRIMAKGDYTMQVLDTPNTTSEIHYQAQIKDHYNANGSYVRSNADSRPGYITAMEIAA